MMNGETTWLQPFIHICQEHHLDYFTGQGRNNRLFVRGDLPPVQFGDLRVMRGSVAHVVEIEGQGGVTNLAKYQSAILWQLSAGFQGAPHRKIVLTHVYNRAAKFQSHHEIWRTLYTRIPLWPYFEAYLHVVRQAELDAVAREFVSRITG